MSYYSDLLDKAMSAKMAAVKKDYEPTRAGIRSSLIERGVDPDTALGGSVLGKSENAYLGEQANIAAETAMQQALWERQDQLRTEAVARDDKLRSDAQKAGKRGMWAKILGTVGGAALGAVVPGGWAAKGGIQAFLSRMLGGGGAAIGSAVGNAVGGGAGLPAATSWENDPEIAAARDQLASLAQRQPLSERLASLKQRLFGGYTNQGYDPFAVQVSPERWDKLYR